MNKKPLFSFHRCFNANKIEGLMFQHPLKITSLEIFVSFFSNSMIDEGHKSFKSDTRKCEKTNQRKLTYLFLRSLIFVLTIFKLLAKFLFWYLADLLLIMGLWTTFAYCLISKITLGIFSSFQPIFEVLFHLSYNL